MGNIFLHGRTPIENNRPLRLAGDFITEYLEKKNNPLILCQMKWSRIQKPIFSLFIKI